MKQKEIIIGASIFAIVVLVGVGFFAWQTTWVRNDSSVAGNNAYQYQDNSMPNSQQLMWQQMETGWQAVGAIPTCPQKMAVQVPADINKATAMLYPGQTRGGNYKPHGGFRFDTAVNNAVTVTAPFDGYIVRGSRYIAEGEVQYTFDMMNNCGVMYRVGHLRVLPANLQKIADTWPAPMEGDSRTQQVEPPVFVKQGEVLATAVGIIAAKNTFFDFGVYDFRQQNAISQSPVYQQQHADDRELSWHAVCWFDWLPARDAAQVRLLPAGDPTSGKTSDYCK